MAKNTSISLGKHFTDFIDGQIESGRYSSACEAVLEAVSGRRGI